MKKSQATKVTRKVAKVTRKSTKATRKAVLANPPWWYAQCFENIKKLGGTMCAQQSCSSQPYQPYLRAFCYCLPPYSNGCVPVNNPPPNCCPNSAATPVLVMPQECYCCCGGSADSTPVAFDKDQYKEIVDFEVGDMIYVADNIKLTSWSQRQVMFSSGAGDMAAPSMMLKVTFGSQDKPDYLVVSRAQLFLIPGGKLKPAAALVPGKDSLVATDGTPRPLLSLEVGIFNKGLHHISTSTSPASSPDGHLIVAKNIVVGDWALQVALSTTGSRPNLALAKGVENMAEFGTKEYQASVAKHKLEINPFRVAVPGLLEPEANVAEFLPFGQGNEINIPKDAFAFLTPEQAADVSANASIAPPASQTGKQIVEHLFKLFGAFYPTVKFTYDEQNLTPNAYFFEKPGVMQLVVTSGLAGCQPVKLEGMALVIATMIGAFTSGPPFNEQGLSGLGIASYAAAGSILPHVWIGMQSVPIFKAGLAQITDLFTCIRKANRGGSDACMNISIDCRIECMNAGFNIKPLPPCAGGPKPGA